MFEIKNLKFKNILDIPYLKINKQISCIVGASGSGKTTLLKMLNRLNIPDEGDVFYNGENTSNISTIELRRKVVMLAQTAIIYGGTIKDNLLIGLEFSQKLPASNVKMKEMLDKVELNKGLEDSCGNLSGGEKQRLCLARVMLMNSQTYLLDEPSSALDRTTENFIITSLINFAKENNKELIIITHSDNIAQMFDDAIIRIEKGRVKSFYNG